MLRGYLADFISLPFPELCPACEASLVVNAHIICSDCRYNLPNTNFHLLLLLLILSKGRKF